MISIYVRNKEICPASYYRITQYFEDNSECKFYSIASNRMFTINQKIDRKGIKYLFWKIVYFLHMTIRGIIYEINDLVRKPNIIIISRSIFPHKCFLISEFLLKINLKYADKVIWDFDDDIFLNGEISKNERNVIQKNADKIVVTHEYLKKLLSDELQDKVITLYTTDGDYDKNIKHDKQYLRDEIFKNEIRIIWVGQAVNLKYFSKIIKQIDEAAGKIENEYRKKTKLIIVCNRQLNVKTQNLIIENIEWSKKRALIEMQLAHIGVMPLSNEKYVLGKGGFKLIQYMAASLPVIGSNIGFNKQIIKHEFGMLVEDDEWKNAILYMVENEKRLKDMSIKARNEWEKGYNFKKAKKMWESIVK